jgi:hypothetical protein
LATNKTDFLHLNDWVGTDLFRREELNENFRALDAKAKEHNDRLDGHDSSLGDITQLNTTDKSSLVNALKEVKTQVNDKADQTVIGDLTQLNTTDKTSVVNAVNEIKTQANNNASQLADMATHPAQYGAIGDGTVDDSTALTNANAVHGNVLISKGNFRVSQNIHLGHVHFMNGGTITIDSGVILTIDAVHADPATVIFKGAGTVVTSDNRYSVGWFEGNYFNNKWDFCKRAWRTEANSGVGIQKYVHVPTPKANDPACGPSIAAPYAWKINAPVTFGFYDDNLIFDSEAIFVGVAPCQMFVFSPHNTGETANNNKTDEIRFPKGLNVEGGTTSAVATDGIVITEGARIIFDGGVRCKLFTNTGVTITPQQVETIEVVFNFLEVTGFGTYGVVIGNQPVTNSTTVPAQIVIRYLFTNGGLSGSQAFCLISGQVRNVTIDKFVEYIATGKYYDVSDGQIVLQSTTAGYPLRVNLKDLYSYVSTKPLVKSYNNGGSTKISELSIEKFTANSASVLVNLAYTSSATIKGVPQSAGTGSIVIGSDCDHVDVEATRNTIISGNCPQLMLNKKYFANYSLATSTAQAITFDNNVNGFVDVIAKEDATCCATFLIRNGGAIVNQVIGSNVTTQSGTVLTGTTGTAGKVNLSYVNSTLYIENQIGSTRTFIVHGITY